MRFLPSLPGAAVLVLVVASASVFAQTPSQGAGRGSAQRRAGFGMGLISRDVPDPAAVERGQKSFAGSCGFCHGTNATGGESGPDLIRSSVALDDEKGDRIGPVIRQGRPANGMPAFPQMTDTQIEDIAAFLRARQQIAINRGNYTIQNLNTGDQQKGQRFFSSHCADCHSPANDLAHIAAKYQPDALIARILYPARRNGRGRGAASTAPRSTVTVTSAGQSYSGTLEYEDDFDVALRDSSGVYRSFARTPGMTVEVSDPYAKHIELLRKYTDADLHDVLAFLETLQ